MRTSEGEPCLADPAGAGQGNEPVDGGEAQDFTQLVIPADQLGNRLRQVGGRRHNRFCTGVPYSALRQKSDIAGKLIASSGDRSDQVSMIPKGGAQRRNLHLQIVLLYHLARPDAGDQRVLAEDGTACLDQRDQHIEGAPAELNRLVV
jgi:hypothetical protein